MDATTRWETEALRSTPSSRPKPPRPSSKRQRTNDRGSQLWVTLREAEAATGIPVNTLRKWVRKAGLDSYLESDGETPVRMVDLDAVRARAAELGRELLPAPERDDDARAASQADAPVDPKPNAEDAATPVLEAPTEVPNVEADTNIPPDTMIVPVDAWNKMLNQLGNLHEAGQQLAAARERAAKAETEASFLRDRLAEMRQEHPPQRFDVRPDLADVEPIPSTERDTEDVSGFTPTPQTTSYWRYVTTGWRQRRRRSKD